jgi:hypothetical protein
MLVLFAAFAGLALQGAGTGAEAETPEAGPTVSSTRLAAPGISFEPNQGQYASGAQYIGRGRGYVVRLEAKRAVIQFQQGHAAAVRRLELALNFATGDQNACLPSAQPCSKTTSVTGVRPLPGTNSYFPKSDAKSWIANLATYAQVNYHDIFNGVDLAFYGKDDRLEYDFFLRPGADPKKVGFTLTGAERLRLDAEGNLDAAIGGEEFKLLKPVAYQPSIAAAKAVQVTAGYRIDETPSGSKRISFILGDYDHSRPLVIDPVLAYGLYIPGTGTQAAPNTTAIVKMTGDAHGNTYQVAQISGSGGAYNVLKYDPNGNLLFNASLESNESQIIPTAIAVDASGNVFVAGTAGAGLVTTANAFQPTSPSSPSALAAFLTEIKADASTVLYSTYLGGVEQVAVSGLGVDASGNAYVSGASFGEDFPATPGAYSTATSSNSNNGFDFVAKINPSLSGKSSLAYSSLVYDPAIYYYNPTAQGVLAVDAAGEAFLSNYSSSIFPTTSGAYEFAGREIGESGAYVTKWNAAGSNLIYTAFLGPGTPAAIAISGSGEAYITGSVSTADFPTTAGAYQTSYAGGFAAKLSPDGSQLEYSTFLSGPSGYTSNNVKPSSIVLPVGCNASCNAYIAGVTSTSDFPTVNPIQETATTVLPYLIDEGFLVELNPAASSASLSTYLGALTSSTNSIAGLSLDSAGNIYFAASIEGPDAPITRQAANPYGGYLAKISPVNGSLALVTPAAVAFPGDSTLGFQNTYFAELRNLGSKPVTLSRPFTFSSSQFSETDQCGTTLAAGGTCQLTILFNPAQSGPISGTMTIHSDAPNQPTIVPLSGIGSDQPALAASAYSLNFPTTLLGSSTASQTITITNNGNLPQAVSPDASEAPDYSFSNSCPTQLAAKASCQIAIAFAPNQLGLLAEVLQIPEPGFYYYFNGTTEEFIPNGFSIALNGTGVLNSGGLGSAVFSADVLNFGSSVVGETAYQYVTVTNQGSTPLVISQVTASTDSPQGANDFSVYFQTCTGPYNCYDLPFSSPTQLLPGASQTFLVSFKPSQAATETGTVNFTDSGSGIVQRVYLSGLGTYTPPALSISAENLAFPPQPVGDPSAPQTFYLSNTGDAPIFIDRAVASGDFQIDPTSGTCEAATVGTCSIAVIFTPTALGARSGTLTLIDSLGNPQVFNLAGTGIQATGAVTVSQSSVTFPAQAQGTTSATIPLTIVNPGNAPVTVNSITASGDFSAQPQFEYSANCAASLAPSATCTFAVAFTPTNASGQDTGTLSIKSTAGTQTVALSGTAVAVDTALEVTPAEIIFPTVKLGNSAGSNGGYSIYIENTGNQPITFTALPTIAGVAPTPSSDFAVGAGNCEEYFPTQYGPTPQPLPPGTYCALSVSFTPTLTTAEKAVLTLVDSAGTRTLVLLGTGSASAPTATVDPYTVTFPPQPAGVSSVYGPTGAEVYFSNTGTAPIKFASIAVTSGSADFPFSSSDSYDCLNQTISPGGNCVVYAYFAPSTTGYRTGLLTFKDTNGNLYYAGLAGYGRKPVKSVVLSPQSIGFPPVTLGDTLGGAPTQYLSLTNSGDYNVTLGTPTSTDIALVSGQSADFAASIPCLGGQVFPGQSCNIAVSFNPLSVGAKQGSLTLPVSYPDKTTSSATATVSGAGLASSNAGYLLPQSASFPNAVVVAPGTVNLYQLSNGVTFTIFNHGNNPFTIGTSYGTNLASSTGYGGDFGTEYSCNNQTVYPGSICGIVVYFIPLTAGLRTGSISFPVTYANGKTTTLTASFSGTGVAPTQQVLVDPVTAQFNAEVAGTLDTTNELTFTVSNAGTGPVKMTSSAVTSNFTVTNDQCSGKTIGPLSANYTNAPTSCAITVASTPLATAAHGFVQGTLSIADGAGTQQVILQGFTLTAAQLLTLSQSTATFGQVQIGHSSPSQIVYLVDRGPASNGTTPDRTQVNGITLTGANPSDFVETQSCGGTLGFTITGRTVCEITVSFAPKAGAAGTRSANVTITPASGLPLVLQLVGQASSAASSAHSEHR